MSEIAERAASCIETERAVPLGLETREVAPDADLGATRGLRLELTSRGDRVPAAVWTASSTGTAPLVALQYGAGGSIDAGHRTAVRALLDAGLAVVTVDWPLHGARRSVKLSERLLTALEATTADPNGASLVEQFALQSALDLSRALDAAATLDGVDARRVGLLGVGLGAHLTALVAASDSRPTALAVGPSRRGTAAAALALAPLLAAGKPRPVLCIEGDGEDAIGASEIETLCVACPGPTSVVRATDGVDPIGAKAAAQAARFLVDAFA